ncbi:MAG TPA: hypothetical protein VIC27_10155, partial [Ktedonobacterales bacterium]
YPSTPYPSTPYPSTQAPTIQSPQLHGPGMRYCQNGHAVAEADAAFCPVCGAPMASGPARG